MTHLQPKHLKKYFPNCDGDVIMVLCDFLHKILLGHVRMKKGDLEGHRKIFEGARRALLLTKSCFELIQINFKFCSIHLS